METKSLTLARIEWLPVPVSIEIWSRFDRLAALLLCYFDRLVEQCHVTSEPEAVYACLKYDRTIATISCYRR
eukprot:6464659-Amphidinium_carterae.1